MRWHAHLPCLLAGSDSGHQLHNWVKGETGGNTDKPAPTAYQAPVARRRLVRCRWVVAHYHHYPVTTIKPLSPCSTNKE